MAGSLSDEALLARLIGFPSVSAAGNREIADFLCNYLEGPGIRIDRFESPDGRKVNVIARFGPSDPERRGDGLTLCGHLDVVPASEAGWQSDPFTLRKSDDAYVARGACDMKGFVSLAVNAALRAAGSSLRNPLALVLTYDEEVGSLGAWQLVQQWNREDPLPRSTIVGEPTSLRVVRLHKGHLKLRITFEGKGAHSGYPALGINAIEPAGQAVAALSRLREEWQRRREETSAYFPETPYVALNVAMIRGGTAVNIVPDRCEIDIGIRPLPGMVPTALADEVRQAVRLAAGADACTVEIVHDNPALLTGEDTPTNRRVCALVGQTDTRGVSYASDAGVLARLGQECVLWGPGDIAVAHKPNESLPRAEFEAAGRMLGDLIGTWCLPAAEGRERSA